ncbi:sodium/calcium exchanger 3 [Tetranychus urticae]|uniref:sodium/calcium exchanger 3 n=1 Tax=Tetranychus urticae TaxID=32264 RepID=UPI00077BEEB0|nr:sodium/calcium exchanger 3 [Tetranychus urticae]
MSTIVSNSSFFDHNGDQCVSRGLMLPYLGYASMLLWVRIVGYLLLLLYLFLGIAIIADIFMCAIERITSQTKKILVNPGDANTPPEYMEVLVWNETVANLTLMALGSSAPEILLAIIEIVSSGFVSGALGPGTIVGSAAYNLFMISAVCVIGIPNHESRTIKAIKVFAVTCTFSVFAYLWLFLILVTISPDVVEVWEALLTFLFFPILVFIAYAADRNFFMSQGIEPAKGSFTEVDSGARVEDFFPKGKISKKSLAKFLKEVRKVDPNISTEDAACLAATYLFEHERHSRLFYRVSACRWLSGSRPPFPHLTKELQQVYDLMKDHMSGGHAIKSVPDGAIALTTVAAEIAHEKDIAVVQFAAPTAAVLENAGSVDVTVVRYGRMDNSVQCLVETLDRTAKAGRDYKAFKEIVTLEPYEKEKTINIEIIDDDNWNPDNIFLVKLTLIDNDNNNESAAVAKGRICMMTVTIVDDDFPGIIAFGQRLITVEEDVGKVVIPVLREQGSDGEIEVKWKTVDGTAKNGRDYSGGEGTLLFAHGVMRQEIEIAIENDFEEIKDEYFEVHLLSATNGAKIGKINSIMVTVTNDSDYNAIMSKLMTKIGKKRKGFKIAKDQWVEQFRSAMTIEGSEEIKPNFIDYFFHVLSFVWKVMFAFVPPPSIWNGWLTFIVSLILIGFITTIVGDTAEAFGCLTGLKPSITAITLVAMGTSLPDTFASKTAARMEKYADNAIGNITGSNSVNVFLGLGLPWLMAAVYWSSKGQIFEVPAGDLGYSVALYTALSFICIAILLLRRIAPIFGPGELGGPLRYSIPTFIIFVILWIIYIAGSVMKAQSI